MLMASVSFAAAGIRDSHFRLASFAPITQQPRHTSAALPLLMQTAAAITHEETRNKRSATRLRIRATVNVNHLASPRPAAPPHLTFPATLPPPPHVPVLFLAGIILLPTSRLSHIRQAQKIFTTKKKNADSCGHTLTKHGRE